MNQHGPQTDLKHDLPLPYDSYPRSPYYMYPPPYYYPHPMPMPHNQAPFDPKASPVYKEMLFKKAKIEGLKQK